MSSDSPHADLLRLADQVKRLRPPGHRNPELFWIEKSQISHQIKEAVARWSGAARQSAASVTVRGGR